MEHVRHEQDPKTTGKAPSIYSLTFLTTTQKIAASPAELPFVEHAYSSLAFSLLSAYNIHHSLFHLSQIAVDI